LEGKFKFHIDLIQKIIDVTKKEGLRGGSYFFHEQYDQNEMHKSEKQPDVCSFELGNLE